MKDNNKYLLATNVATHYNYAMPKEEYADDRSTLIKCKFRSTFFLPFSSISCTLHILTKQIYSMLRMLSRLSSEIHEFFFHLFDKTTLGK
jgi:hypothetical protein